MTLRRIDNDNKQWQKMHPEHNPPNMIVLEPGTYEHTCPGCGAMTIFVVPPRPTLGDPPAKIIKSKFMCDRDEFQMCP